MYSIHDMLGACLWADANALDVTGTPAETMVGNPSGEQILPEDRNVMADAYSIAVEQGVPTGMAARRIDPDGYHWVSTVFRRAIDPKRGVPVLVAMTRRLDQPPAEAWYWVVHHSEQRAESDL